MTKNTFDEQLQGLMELTYSETIEQLIKTLDISKAMIRTWRSRKKIPDRIILQANMIFAKGSPVVELDISKKVNLKTFIMEGLFSAVKQKNITLSEEVKVGDIADVIISEIPSEFINTNQIIRKI